MSYYHGLISSRKANGILSEKGDGSFLLRDSQSQPGNFVLSAKSGGRLYHVLIFNRNGQYSLDSAGVVGESEDPPLFDSLDDLIVYMVGHDLRIEGADVQLHEVVHCAEEPAVPTPSAAPHKTSETEDSDQLTDLFATLFGAQCSVISMAHSKVTLDGQALEEGKEHLGIIVKDNHQKGFCIKIIDIESKKVVAEKKITKTFQYDTPSDLVMAYLSEHGITCLGFRDVWERERFLHQVDRVVRLQQDRAVRLRARGDSAHTNMQNPTKLTHKLKASEFDIHNLKSEWQYLFDLAGVTRAMLEDQSTLQFILDTTYQLGGAPKKLEQVQQEAVSSVRDGGDVGVERRRERMKVLAVDHALRRESLRASKLSEELKKKSLKREILPLTKATGCAYKAQCERFKDHLMLKHSLFALGPEHSTCYCEQCVAGQPVVQVSGSPPQQYSMPVGWCQFVHRSQTHSLAQHFCSRWHVAYCSVASSRAAGVMRMGQLPHSHSSGEVVLSPDIHCAVCTASITPESYFDDVSSQKFRVDIAFQVYIQPQTYAVESSDSASSSVLHSQLEWHARERTYIVHALLVRMTAYD